MPDLPGVNNGKDGVLPPAPPAGNQPPGATDATPPVEEKSLPPVPFDRDPALQDYINRTVESRLQGILEKFGAAQPKPAAQENDPLEAIAQELAKEEEIKPEVARAFVGKFKRIVEHTTKSISDRLTQHELTQKFSQVFSRYEDAETLAPQMRTVFSSLSELERNFVLNSPDGADFLYQKARRESNRSALPPSVRVSAGNPPPRSPSMPQKVEGSNTLRVKAAEALKRGDRAGYDDVMAQIMRG